MAHRPDETNDRRRALLDWYDRHRRDLPWRAAPGERIEPYRVLVSEFMLQQTTAATVKSRFGRFLERFPTIAALARADESEVLHAWQGLGYYRRARALHACARSVMIEHAGSVPDQPSDLLRLPGIGRYTANAIGAIAFERPVVPVDGNIRRVVARLSALPGTPEPDAAEAAATMLFAGYERPGDVAQALMDLGATVCTPRRPACLLCPLHTGCRAHRSRRPEDFPSAATRKTRPRRSALAFLLRLPDGAVLFSRRPQNGLLGGMHEVPSSPWQEGFEIEVALRHAPVSADWHLQTGQVRHVFTHFELELTIATADAPDASAIPNGSFWCHPAEFDRLALPTVMRKVLKMAGVVPQMV